MTGLDLMIAFALAYFFGLLFVALIIHSEMQREKRKKEWEENKLMLTFLFFQAFLMVITIFYLAANPHIAFWIWLFFVILNIVAFFLAFTEAIYRRNVLAVIASVVAFTMLILFGL